MQKTRGVALLTASVLAMSSLAACGDEGGDAGESTSSTASPSAPEKESSSGEGEDESSTSKASASEGSSESGDDEVAELPAAAKKQTKAGAIAFNEFYQEQMGEALKTGRTQTLEEFSHEECEVCATYIKQTSDRTSENVTMNKNPNRVGTATATPRTDSGFKVTLTVRASEYHEVLPDGKRGRSADAVTYKLTTDTQWHEGHWVIRDSVIVE